MVRLGGGYPLGRNIYRDSGYPALLHPHASATSSYSRGEFPRGGGGRWVLAAGSDGAEGAVGEGPKAGSGEGAYRGGSWKVAEGVDVEEVWGFKGGGEYV